MTQSFVYESGEGMAVKAPDLEEDSPADEQPASIVRHDAAVARAFRLLGVEPENWVPTRPGTDHDVVVVGGGQSGVAIAVALRRAGITRTTVIDAADEGAEGVWLTTARMNKLRSPKTLPGPELGMFDLGFQSWYEARHGEKAFAAMDAIPRLDWAAYLRWFRKAAGIPVRYGARLDRIEPDGRGLRLRLSVDGQAVEEVCRKLVLATGFAGSGGMNFPAFVKRVVPKRLRAHAEEEIDFYKLRGRRIAIFGAASSAFDAAAVALEHGAASAHLFCRHDDLERCFPMRMLFYPGSVEHFRELPDADRWRIMSTLCRRAQGPAPDTVKRAARFKAFHLHLGARNPVLSVHNDQIRLELVAGNTRLELEFDFVIAGTGYSMDLSQRPELAGIVEHIASWSDRYSPPAWRRERGTFALSISLAGLCLHRKTARRGVVPQEHPFFQRRRVAEQWPQPR